MELKYEEKDGANPYRWVVTDETGRVWGNGTTKTEAGWNAFGAAQRQRHEAARSIEELNSKLDAAHAQLSVATYAERLMQNGHISEP